MHDYPQLEINSLYQRLKSAHPLTVFGLLVSLTKTFREGVGADFTLTGPEQVLDLF